VATDWARLPLAQAAKRMRNRAGVVLEANLIADEDNA
jgi:hypothetical protein